MKKCILIALGALLWCTGMTAFAEEKEEVPLSIKPVEQILEVGTGTKLPSFWETGQHPDAPPDYLQPGVGTATSPFFFVLDFLRYAMSTIAFIMVVVYTLRLITQSEEEEATKAKKGLAMGVIGLLLIQLADVIVKKMVFGEQGDAFQDAATAQLYAEESVTIIRSIIGVIQVFVGVVAVLVLVIRGSVLITSAGNEEAITKARNHVLYAIAGLILIGLAELIIRGFIFPNQGESLPDIGQGRDIIIMITNFFAGFVAVIAFLILVYTGYRYIVSAGNDEVTEKVKKTFYGALIGLLLALGAFALVNTLLDASTEEQLTETIIEP